MGQSAGIRLPVRTEAFHSGTLLDAEAFLKSWRAKRAFVAASAAATSGVVLFALGMIVDVITSDWHTLVYDGLGFVCAGFALLMARHPARQLRSFTWIPLFAAVLLNSIPNVIATGDVLSPQLGSYIVLAFGLLLIVNPAPRELSATLLITSIYLAWPTYALYKHGVAHVSSHGAVIAGSVILIVATLLCFIILFRTERRLADAVVRGNRQLVNARLEINQVQEANAAKTAFLVNISHEIRTPLISVLGYSDLIAQGHLAPDTRSQFHEAIRRNGQHLLNLLDDLLDLARVESGRLITESQSVNPRALVEEAVDAFVPRARTKGISLQARLATNVPVEVQTDGKRLRQILLNLIDNAVKFTDSGSILVHAYCEQSEATEKPSQLRISVQDTGSGISVIDQKKLFLPFSQADSSLTRRHGGAGIGLALARQIARALGGDVELLRSVPGEGSLFCLSLPLK